MRKIAVEFNSIRLEPDAEELALIEDLSRLESGDLSLEELIGIMLRADDAMKVSLAKASPSERARMTAEYYNPEFMELKDRMLLLARQRAA
jgi:hypothetical protein